MLSYPRGYFEGTNIVDERKSWKRLIFAYAGAGVLVLVAGFFIVRGASSNALIVAHAGSTPTPTVVGVYSGIAPDATQPPAAATQAPSPTPAPSDSPTPGQHPTSTPAAKAPVKLVAQTKDEHKHQGVKHHSKVQLVAEVTKSESDAGHIVPIAHPNADQPAAEKPAPAANVETATETPATAAPVVATPVPEEAAPVFAPNRIVDAQVRVAVQPEYSEMDRERGARGTSVVLVTIDPKGRVVNTSVGSSSGYASLDRAAMAAARSSEFVAPKINGRPATETYRVVYDFAP